MQATPCGAGPCAQGVLGIGQATKLARDMVTRYGMSDVLGLTSIDYEDGRSLSGETRALVEKEVCSHINRPSVVPASLDAPEV